MKVDDLLTNSTTTNAHGPFSTVNTNVVGANDQTHKSMHLGKRAVQDNAKYEFPIATVGADTSSSTKRNIDKSKGIFSHSSDSTVRYVMVNLCFCYI